MNRKPKAVASFYIEKELLDEFKEYAQKTCGNVSWLIVGLIKKELGKNDNVK